MRYVIVGNGVASLGAMEGIRDRDSEGEIYVFSREEFPTYGRPLISYYLSGKVPENRMWMRPEEFYANRDVQLRLGTEINKVDPSKNTLFLEDGSQIDYDRLLLATGGEPIFPPIEGSEGPDVYTFISLADAHQMKNAVQDTRRAVVIGGGLIGLKAAEALYDCGLEVSIVELAPRILSAAFDDEAGNIVTSRLQDLGFNIHCSTTVEKIKRGSDRRIKGVFLQDGSFLETDMVVMAIGVNPQRELAEHAGLEVNRGIVVNDQLQTSSDNVFAAGDVAEGGDLLWGDHRITPIWPDAYSQGIWAGRNMAGAGLSFSGSLAMNSIGFYGLSTVSIGIVNPPEDDGFEIRTELDAERQNYRKLVFRADKLVGCVLLGDISAAGRYNAFIRFQIPLDAKDKDRLTGGQPTPLQWPENLFQQEWNSRARLI